MELRLDPDLQTFRTEVRAFIDSVLPADMKERQRRKVANNAAVPDLLEWMRILNAHGRSVPHWPVEFGGCGWTPMQLFIFNEELYKADAPEFDWGGTHMLGPVLYTYGSDYLKDRFLPMIREGATMWAQGFSEPGSGSDLASLRTSAELVGDKYIVNGQKIWTSGAAHADWGFFLVRTDKTVKPQRGISFLIIKMDTPGITVRQIPQINGEAHLCEVFLDNVEVPADQLIGEPGMGWTYAKFLLEHERTTSSFIYWSKRELARAKDIALGESVGGRRVADDPAFRARFAKAEADLLALEWSVLRVLAHEELDEPEAAAASVLKIRGSELQQEITMLQVDAMGAKSLRFFDAAPVPPPAPTDVWPDYAPGRTTVALINRAATIYGGSKQIQKNILARLAFGL
ncbi:MULTISPECIES: acyl-CoA dehydrogenase family protein [Sphingobium]|jgi:alkylation response protein AidB-like acyl-CoA dehydrogenase|uniref:Acyl-CoA dehydrogenase n=1 Tax=Sphingobium fuliginis (strain ATCC 27551) TaxID=336203 RepID=A0A292ZNH3_SPHSA|nr:MULTISPECIES: acyl-CoA dehydrogenase family protein [Sphingobium]AJR23313.1 acyl-CoA dehydrogenase [Sphingobium sp. YBL2]MCB4862299.1 acyl-CoA dehydrogenase family protein [Sphingobium sp. PNB]QOT73309.1 acyl-CoA dehydrogenase family protein [Sphingobium fuliginis]RYL98123.1 acyl-CoA dehydrogenase [Sphingobium fuliginis]WDA34833.1 acyl-CoA dehydrogenase family protein [Sphingobium sp. YC-XJ3]